MYLHMQSPAGKLLVVASISIIEGNLRMIKEVEVDPDGSLTRRWGTRADDVRVKRTTSDLEEGLLRINEYAYRLEDARAGAAYGVRSAVDKVRVIYRERLEGRSDVVLVVEVL